MTDSEVRKIKSVIGRLKDHDRPYSKHYSLKAIGNEDATSITLSVDDSGSPVCVETITTKTLLDIFESYLKNNQ